MCAAVPSVSGARDGPGNAPRETRSPFTYLYDTGAASPAPLPAQVLARKAGWAVVPEDDLGHRFAGDAVFSNDRIAVVLRRNSPGAEVYSRAATGMRRRALLVPCPPRGAAEEDRAAASCAVKTVENNPGAVVLDAAFRTQAGESCSVRFRLTTGEGFLETRAGEGTSRLVIRGKTRLVVVPDFFGDDMVFDAEAFETSRVGLPAENFFLSMIEGGDAIVMCVWESNERNAEIAFSGEGRRRAIAGSEVQCMTGEKIWVAVLEGPGIWHARAISAEDGGADVVLDWRPPFPAKWRGSFFREDGVAESWSFTDAPAPGGPTYPCRFDSNRAIVVRPSGRMPGPLVVYPIDRSRSTPLTVVCPIDVVRNTLGVGPCEYILEMEGLGSEAPATPEQVTHWVERLFKRKRAKRKSDEIAERLEEMTGHIRSAEKRIGRYGDFAREIRELCVREERSNPATSGAVRKLRSIARDAERSIATGREGMKTPEFGARLAGRIAALLGRADALAECKRLGAEIRSIGAAQDKTLAKCRMAVRRLKQQCRMTAAAHPRAAGFAGSIQERAERMLRKKR